MKKHETNANIEDIKNQFKEKQEESRQTFSLTLILSFIIFVTAIVILFVTVTVIYFLAKTDIVPLVENSDFKASRFLLLLMISSLLIGIALAYVTKKFPMKTIDTIVNQINKLASGDYSARIKFGKFSKRFGSVGKIERSFNKMADELQSTEMLRSDFVNNFSHEFKTPIVSIAGFAKLLRRGNLTEEQKEEYLQVIEEESLRLSYMATNILNLTKVENQTILTDVNKFNLSEQIRDCILILESKWSKKNLDLSVEFDEHEIYANQELLKQVWINLLDNAVKFSPEYGMLKVAIEENDDYLYVSISNNGEPIPEEKQNKIFNKFYQADESHASLGNGIGLAIVKKVTELHKGRIYINSTENLTTFTIALPKNHSSK